MDWLLSDEIADGSNIPFVREAAEFRDSFDKLIAAYDQAMSEAHQVPVKGKA